MATKTKKVKTKVPSEAAVDVVPAEEKKAKKKAKTPKPVLDLTWTEPQAKKDKNDTHRKWIWWEEGDDARYRVIRLQPLYDTGTKPKFIPYHKELKVVTGNNAGRYETYEPILGKDSTDAAKGKDSLEDAFASCEEHLARQLNKPAIDSNSGERFAEAGKIFDSDGNALNHLPKAPEPTEPRARAASGAADSNGVAKAPKVKRPRTPGAGDDPFGAKVGSGRAALNAALTMQPQSMADLCKIADCCPKPSYMETLRGKGFVTKSDNKWALTDKGAELLGKKAAKEEEPKAKKKKDKK